MWNRNGTRSRAERRVDEDRRRSVAVPALLLSLGLVAVVTVQQPGGNGRPAAPGDVPVAAAAAATPPDPDATIAGRARAVDGDTLRVGGETVRLLDIDAPESDQFCHGAPCGHAAFDALRAILAQGPATCDGTERDSYGRRLAACRVRGRDVGAEMVRRGHAAAFRRHSDRYAPQEAEARAAQRGMWQHGTPEMPWDHRRAARLGEATGDRSRDATGPHVIRVGDGAGCRIKGNVSKDGERIYHVPGQKYYDRTKISPRNGERWFCSEDEARAAGWRRARV